MSRTSILKENNPNFKHGESKTRLYLIWHHIKDRCLNLNHKFYEYYGGRGITICPEWTNDYIKFRDWALSNGYKENLQINRINNNGNYEPNNCNWVTSADNCQNKRNNVIKNMEIANEIRTLHKTGLYTQKEIAEEYKVDFRIISKIINNKQWKRGK